MRQLTTIILAGVLGLLPIFAGSNQNARAQLEQDVALGAVRDANVIPYGRIKGIVETRYQGRVIGQQLVQAESGEWIYEFKLLRQSGHLIILLVNATSGRVLDTWGK